MKAAQAEVTLYASGRVVCPGFIDIHGHSDVSLFEDPGAESKVYQGITTDVVGNCGQSPFPCGRIEPADLQRVIPMTQPGSQLAYNWMDLDGWAQALEGNGISLNVVPQVGHSALRQAAHAVENRPAIPEELEYMKRLVAEAFEQGAVALTTALTGPPAMHASPEEIAELAAEAGRYEHAFYASHARLLAGWHFNAVDEAIDSMIISLDKKSRKINLSIKDVEIDEEQKVLSKYGSSDSGIMAVALKWWEEWRRLVRVVSIFATTFIPIPQALLGFRA